jgi:hypothetical protein
VVCAPGSRRNATPATPIFYRIGPSMDNFL